VGDLKEPEFGKHGLDREPKYRGLTTRSLHVTVRDGVRIAVDVMLPEGLQPEDKLPTLLMQTRYWRSRDIRAPFRWFQKPLEVYQFFTSHGYALVVADVRGTGASFGTRPYPWSRDEILDGGDIVDWIVEQPCSNGLVGSLGTSYLGTTAELLAVNRHPAVKAVVPRFSQFDLYTYIPFPGGVFCEWFIRQWAHHGIRLDRNLAQEMVASINGLLEEKEAALADELPRGFRLLQRAGELRLARYALRGVRPVDSDGDRRLLREAVRAHEDNENVYDQSQGYIYRDDVRPGPGATGYTIDDISVHSFMMDIEGSGVGVYSWGSWMDAATADAVISRFQNYSNPQRAVIGPWNHGGLFHASPYVPVGKPVEPSEPEQWMECLRFLDHHLMGVEDEDTAEKLLIYYTLGEERWKRTGVWPPEGGTTQRWYLSAEGRLSQSTPTDESGADTYAVDFEATTNVANRWHTQLGFAVVYPDRAEEDHRLLTYTSKPLEENTEITGHPVVTLYVTSTATDGAFFVYLEDVDEAGRVTYVTEGQLRAIHRKVSARPPPYEMMVPYHTFRKDDAMPLVPGEIAELTFGLLPTSVLIRRNHRIRIAIAGHDKDTFARIPEEGAPVITVVRNGRHASFIDLPVMKGD
jgi:putative CocE/NonD family hydrolase